MYMYSKVIANECRDVQNSKLNHVSYFVMMTHDSIIQNSILHLYHFYRSIQFICTDNKWRFEDTEELQ